MVLSGENGSLLNKDDLTSGMSFVRKTVWFTPVETLDRETNGEELFPPWRGGPSGLERKAVAEGKLTRDSHFLPLR